jgi:hypothetical protein
MFTPEEMLSEAKHILRTSGAALSLKYLVIESWRISDVESHRLSLAVILILSLKACLSVLSLRSPFLFGLH